MSPEMFPISLIRHVDPELFIAIVSPAGADVDRVYEGLAEALKRFNYDLEPIKVIEQLKRFSEYLQDEPTAEDERIKCRMDAGDAFRAKLERNDALALLSLLAIYDFRRKHGEHDKPVPRRAYLFRSLKRPEEITALRRIY